MTTRSRYLAAVNDKPWWLAGGIPQSACVAAYQAKGASSLAASYVNLANPGSYTLTDVYNAVTWNSTGWIFDKTKALNTGIIPVKGMWSFIAKYDQETGQNGCILGTKTSNATSAISGIWYGDYCQSANGADVKEAPSQLTGTLAMAGLRFYRNGIYSATKTDVAGDISTSFWIGSLNQNNNDQSAYRFKGTIYAVSIYNTIIFDHQVAALTNAMNAL